MHMLYRFGAYLVQFRVLQVGTSQRVADFISVSQVVTGDTRLIDLLFFILQLLLLSVLLIAIFHCISDLIDHEC